MSGNVAGPVQSSHPKMTSTVAMAAVPVLLAVCGMAQAEEVLPKQDSGFIVSIDPYLHRGEFAHQLSNDDEYTRGIDFTVRNVRGDGWIETGFGYAANDAEIQGNGSGDFTDFENSVTDLGLGAGYRWDDFEVRGSAIMRQRSFDASFTGSGTYESSDWSAEKLLEANDELYTGGDSYIFELEGTQYFGNASLSVNWAYEDFEGGDLGANEEIMDSVQSLGARLGYLLSDEFVVGLQGTHYNVSRSTVSDIDYSRWGAFAAWQPVSNLAFRMSYSKGAEDSRDEYNRTSGYNDRSESSLVFGLVWSFGSSQKPVWQAAQGSFLNVHRDLGVSLTDEVTPLAVEEFL